MKATSIQKNIHTEDIHIEGHTQKNMHMKGTYTPRGGTYTRKDLNKLYTEEYTHERTQIRRDIRMNRRSM